MKPWRRVEPTIVTKIDYHTVTIKTFETPDDKLVTRATFAAESSKAAAVIALTVENKVLIVRQFRPGPERIMNEIPGGGVEVNEDPAVAARRELLEETGYTPGKMISLGTFSRDAYMNGEWSYYLATDCVQTHDQSLDDDEHVTLDSLSIDEFIESAKQGKMTDTAAVLAAYDQLRDIQKRRIDNETTN
jgi:ADP-ribose pyrophosphatase